MSVDLDTTGAQMALVLSKVAVYEYRDIWAEERTGASGNSGQWSFGDSAVGFFGLPVDAGWQVEALYFNADSYAANATVNVDLMNYGLNPTNAAANTLATISLAGATDGGGQINNAFKYRKLPVPVAIPTGASGATLIGFITRATTGAVTNMRVGARLRRKVGDFVTNVTLS